MSEAPSKFPGEFEQMRNFFHARKELKNIPLKLRGFQTTILSGLMTIIPQEIQASGILESPQRIVVIGAIGNYQVGLNDRIDYEGSGRKDISDLIQEARNREMSAREKLDRSLLSLPEAEAGQTRDRINTATQEIEYVEKWIREKRDNDNLNFSDIDRYRNLVNAISNVLATSIVFGKEIPPPKQDAINEAMTIEEMEDKYSWAMGNNPKNEIKRSIIIMHNVMMAAQIVDDWQGKHIDELLNIPSYASAALEMAGGDKKAAKSILYRKKDEHMAKTQALGLGIVATKGPIILLSTLVGSYNFLIKKARHSEWLKKRLTNPFFLRESDYMSGKLDKRDN